MSFDDPAVRAAYRKGVKDCYDSAMIRVDRRYEQQIIEWIQELSVWESGDPPIPPHEWE